MNKRIIGIFVCTLLIATIVPVASEVESNDDILTDEYEIIYIQEPRPPSEEPNSWISDISDSSYEAHFRAYDNFWGLTGRIRKIQWWNVPGRYVDDVFYSCDPEGSIYTITFCEDDGTGKPGDVICIYENVMPTMTATGIMYEFPSYPVVVEPLELYIFEVVLNSSCPLSDGWISIVKTDDLNGCLGAILTSNDGNGYCYSYDVDTMMLLKNNGYDFSYALHTYKRILHGEGSLSWTDVKPGEDKTGIITVENTGEPGSLLDWRVESNITWGDWIFSPESGDDLTPEDGPVNIIVTVTAPDEKNTEFIGNLKIVNKKNYDDYYTVSVTLTTSKNKAFIFHGIFERLLYRFPFFDKILKQNY